MRNTVIVQLDGVSLTLLQKAIDNGVMPYTASLIKNGWRLKELFSGLPSTTPAAQLTLFYGIRNLLPGFRFVIKSKKMVFMPQNIDSVEYLENLAYKKNPYPLLKAGRGNQSIFNGGSSSSVSATLFKNNKKQVFRFVLHILNPFGLLLRLLKVVVLIVIERSEKKMAHPHPDPIKKQFVHLFKRVLHEIIFGEFGLYLVKKSIKEKVPVIYVNFPGYDEIAHYYGTNNNFSVYYLSVLDLYIRGVAKEIERQKTDHELLILSDHGQTPSMPIESIIGTSIGKKIASLYPNNKIIEHEDPFNNTYMNKADLYILNSGGISLQYVLGTKKMVSREELEKTYLDYCNKVSRIPGVEFVIARQKELVVVKNARTYALNDTKLDIIFPHILTIYRSKLLQSVQGLMSGPHAPDVCVIAQIKDIDNVVAFEDQNGVHGGFGGLQTQPFFLSKNMILSQSLPDLAEVYEGLYSFIYR